MIGEAGDWLPEAAEWPRRTLVVRWTNANTGERFIEPYKNKMPPTLPSVLKKHGWTDPSGKPTLSPRAWAAMQPAKEPKLKKAAAKRAKKSSPRKPRVGSKAAGKGRRR